MKTLKLPYFFTLRDIQSIIRENNILPHYLLRRRILTLFILFTFIIENPLRSQVKSEYDQTTISGNPKYEKLFDFDGVNGKSPNNILIAGNRLFGTCPSGGKYDGGILFVINIDGANFQRSNLSNPYGSHPTSLVFSGDALYGATARGGDYDGGVLFKMGNYGYQIIHHFEVDYAGFHKGIQVHQNMIIGICTSLDTGFIFSINIEGYGYKKLASLDRFPKPELLVYGDYIYGISHGEEGIGGSPGYFYKIKNDGTEFDTLHYFDSMENGKFPVSNLVMADDTIFGTTREGGIYNYGTVYKISNDGSGFEIAGSYIPDDQYDYSGCDLNHLVLADTCLYAIDFSGGITNKGALSSLSYASGLTKIIEFKNDNDGLYPGEFVIYDNIVYGITQYGGEYGKGVIYKYNLGGILELPHESLKSIRLSIEPPEKISLKTIKQVEVENGIYINLDTTFSITPQIPFDHTWKVKSGSSFEIVNPVIEITGDCTFYLFLTTKEGCSYSDSVLVNVKQSTGIEMENIKESCIIYPNPSNGSFTISISSGYDKYSYELIDNSGRIVDNGNIFCSFDDCTLNIKLNTNISGFYTIVIKRKDYIIFRQSIIIL